MTVGRTADLSEQRDFLRRSLVDLDAELAAGDVTQADYVVLRDQYTARLAEVLRAEEGVQPLSGALRPRVGGRGVATAAVVVVVAVAAGLAVARFSGTRLKGQSITGQIRQSTNQRLSGCLDLASNGQLLDAVKCYDEVLKEQPSSVEARTLVRMRCRHQLETA